MCWERPPSGWKKLNTDGAFNGDVGLAGCGGIVRDERGREGLLLCCDINISHLGIELDAKIRIKHCYREVNKCANSLARLSFTQDAEFSSFISPPVDIFSVFEDDLNELYFDRLCPVPFVFS
uniref:RNase H type-1 domain-containing protein n=1 Tax=Quercus lobata TaxID=97700 RepID=A0A7N2LYR4_QUELO